MNKLITISVPEDWSVNTDLLASGEDLEFLKDLKELLEENDMIVKTFTVGDVIEVDNDDFLGNCTITRDTVDGSIFLISEDSGLPYGIAVTVVDNTKISIVEMDSIVGSEDYSW